MPKIIEVRTHTPSGISGTTMPNAVVEAINLSTAPAARLHLTDTVEIGKADADGNFKGKYIGQLKGSREGDVIRLRARTADGQVSNWLTIRLAGVGSKDTRNAAISVDRVNLVARANGEIEVSNLTSRPISEPDAKIQIVNERTGAKKVITLDADGTFKPDTRIKGKDGDTFTIAISDGKNNADFSEIAGHLTCGQVSGNETGPQLKDPTLHPDECDKAGKPKFSLRRFSGPLFSGGVKAADVAQGYLGDCFFPSAMASIADARPEAIKKMIEKNDDGTFTVTFRQWVESSGAYKPVEIKVDGDLWSRTNGEPLYGTSNNTPKTDAKMEMWWPIVEKAYAMWKGGSYKGIGNGGSSCDIFEACLGMWPEYEDVKSLGQDKLWATIKKAAKANVPMCAGTFGEKRDALYTNTGVYSDHSYSVLGYEEGAGGKRFVKLRNPWGETEPAGNGKDDGFFKLPLDTFCTLFECLHWCSAP